MGNKMEELEKAIGYKFQNNKDLLRQAMTHSSLSNEEKGKESNYERLEFLGDAILEFIVSEYLFNRYPKMSEGELTRTRASLVCETSLSKLSRKLNLGKFLRLSYGEQNNGGRDRSSILCDVFESTIAAIFLDGGLAPAKKFIITNVFDNNKKGLDDKDYKTKLQEQIQQKFKESANLSYQLVREEGPDHDKRFYVEAKRNNKLIGKGEGRTKKAAEQNAAKEALEHIEDII